MGSSNLPPEDSPSPSWPENWPQSELPYEEWAGLDEGNWPGLALTWLFSRWQNADQAGGTEVSDRPPDAVTEAIATSETDQIETFVELLLEGIDAHWLSLGDGQPRFGDPAPHSNDSPGKSNSEKSQNLSRQQRSTIHRLRTVLQITAARVLRLRLEGEGVGRDSLISPELLADLAAKLSAISPIASSHCLQILSAQGDEQSLDTLSQCLANQPISQDQSVAIALSPLFQWPPSGLASVYQGIGEAIWNWHLLGPMLDLAGHAVRKGKLKEHPLRSEAHRLLALLKSATARLSRMEADPKQFGDDVTTIQRVLSNAVSMTVSLCDALGLIGDRHAVPDLKEAMELSHRRIQTEAAGALARMGDQAGIAHLIHLAADRTARVRALAYLDELDIDDPKLELYREPLALAEADAVNWLADRDRFGVPPTILELIDERSQYWPGFEEPRNCFLFRFTYRLAQGDLSNIMIAGPVVLAFQADLRGLPIEDVYAVFAGWQVEHEEIYEVPVKSLNLAQRSQAEALLAQEELNYEQMELLALTGFFGEAAVIATAKREGRDYCLVCDGSETVSIACDDRPTSFTPDLVLALYRGRKLLRTFNP